VNGFDPHAAFDRMDERLRRHLEADLGFPLTSLPSAGVEARESAARTDEPGNRLLIQRVFPVEGAVVTAVPRLLDRVASAIQGLHSWELFSPLGVAALRAALWPQDREKLALGFDYTMADERRLLPVAAVHTPVPLRKADIPAEQFDLRMSERRSPVPEDFTWGFVCCRAGRRASTAVILWKGRPDYATLGVETEEPYRRQGYGLAVVSAATQYILREGGVAGYGAYVANVASIRLARRLGFTLTSQQICA
jgi:RimJ/RimL family protein N-acetyltransferase